MKILITNTHLVLPHGSELWTAAIAQDLVKRGNEVFLFTLELGEFYLHRLRNIPAISNPGSWQYRVPEEHEIERDKEGNITYQPQDPEPFDIAIIQHLNAIKGNKTFEDAVFPALPPSKKTIIMCHGIAPEPEKPLPRKGLLENAHYVCISEEIKDHYDDFPWDIVKQPITQAWFDLPTRPKVKKPERILWASHRHPRSESFTKYCIENQIGIYSVGDKLMYPHEIREVYSQVDLVVGTGRWIYEAIAAGIPAIVADDKKSLGYVTIGNVGSLENFNMTVRHPQAKESDWEQLFAQYRTVQVKPLKKYAIENYHASKITDRLLAILGVESVGEIANKVFG